MREVFSDNCKPKMRQDVTVAKINEPTELISLKSTPEVNYWAVTQRYNLRWDISSRFTNHCVFILELLRVST